MRTRRISGDSRNEPPVLLVKQNDVTKRVLERAYPEAASAAFPAAGGLIGQPL